MKKLLIVLLIVVLIVCITGAVVFSPLTKPKKPADIQSFEDCEAAGFLVVDTKPRECHTKAGQVFIEEYNQKLLEEYLVVTEPKVHSVVSSPFKIEGKAKGNWYYNDQLLVKLIDENQKVIMVKTVKALDKTKDTSAFVPFVAAIDFQKPETAKGTLIIEKTNPANQEGPTNQLIIPVKFK